MQISQISQRIDKLAHTWEHFKSVNDERLKQIEQKGSSDPLTDQKLNKVNIALDEYKSKLAHLETALNRPNLKASNCDEQSPECKSALISYLRKGVDNSFNNLASKSLSVNSNPDGGFLVDKVTSKQIVKRIEANSVMRQLASIEEISTHVLEVIQDEDNLEAGWVGETEARDNTKTPQVNKHRIEVHEIYAQPKATQKLIDDSKIDIANWLTERISDRFAAVESQAFINGDGVNKPKGILTYPESKDKGCIEQLNISYKALSADDIIALYYSLPSKYASKGSFLMHRNMLQSIRTFKCPTTGHYLWAPGLAIGSPDTLLGASVYESPDMPLPADNALAIAFADFKEAYKIVDRTNVAVIRDPFTEKPFVKFYATKRVGGSVVNSRAIKLLKLADYVTAAKKTSIKTEEKAKL
jgi:HK97 family phage major capsid protein